MRVSAKTAARSAGGATRATRSNRSGAVAASAAASAPSERPTSAVSPLRTAASAPRTRSSRTSCSSAARSTGRSGDTNPSPFRVPAAARSRWRGGTSVQTSYPARERSRAYPDTVRSDGTFHGGTRTAVPRAAPAAGSASTIMTASPCAARGDAARQRPARGGGGGSGGSGPKQSSGAPSAPRNATARRRRRSSVHIANVSTSRWRSAVMSRAHDGGGAPPVAGGTSRLDGAEPVDGFDEPVEVEWLGERRVGLEPVERVRIRRGRRREHHRRNPGEARVAPLLRAECPAVHHRHREVEQDDARHRAAERRERLAPVARARHLESPLDEQLGESGAQGRVVLDEQDACVRSHGWPYLGHANPRREPRRQTPTQTGRVAPTPRVVRGTAVDTPRRARVIQRRSSSRTRTVGPASTAPASPETPHERARGAPLFERGPRPRAAAAGGAVGSRRRDRPPLERDRGGRQPDPRRQGRVRAGAGAARADLASVLRRARAARRRHALRGVGRRRGEVGGGKAGSRRGLLAVPRRDAPAPARAAPAGAARPGG